MSTSVDQVDGQSGISSLNLEDLDIEELEARVELAVSVITAPDGCFCYWSNHSGCYCGFQW